jgi:hypothetical protein
MEAYKVNYYLLFSFSEDEEEKFRHDRKLWEAADINKDDKISKDEFSAILHPHQFDHMKDLVLENTMKQIDTDKDGYISLNEYIGKSHICCSSHVYHVVATCWSQENKSFGFARSYDSF